MMKYEANNGNLIKNLNILPHQFSVSYCSVIGVIIIALHDLYLLDSFWI